MLRSLISNIPKHYHVFRMSIYIYSVGHKKTIDYMYVHRENTQAVTQPPHTTCQTMYISSKVPITDPLTAEALLKNLEATNILKHAEAFCQVCADLK